MKVFFRKIQISVLSFLFFSALMALVCLWRYFFSEEPIDPKFSREDAYIFVFYVQVGIGAISAPLVYFLYWIFNNRFAGFLLPIIAQAFVLLVSMMIFESGMFILPSGEASDPIVWIRVAGLISVISLPFSILSFCIQKYILK